ncbi:MAG TPA: zinc-ribbon domain-containing protein [Sphingomicrobium sp.]|nr:zinc-ribbon domain-containing protein [Sphingomicrobium sp.]
MILTCPACGTQYVVKDDAIPPRGRKVRCSSCHHSWHQGPEGEVAAEPPETDDRAASEQETESGIGRGDRPEHFDQPAETAATSLDALEPVALPVAGLVEPPFAAPIPPPDEAQPAATGSEIADPQAYEPDYETSSDPDFSPFARREPADEERRRSPLLIALIAALLIAALAAAFWFLAPSAWKEQIGLASAGETSLELMVTHRDRSKLASGHELLTVGGRVINPTEQAQPVPPIHAQLHSKNGELIYNWTIAPPARTLPPGGSASFNSTEVNVPPGGDDLTITLGDPTA